MPKPISPGLLIEYILIYVNVETSPMAGAGPMLQWKARTKVFFWRRLQESMVRDLRPVQSVKVAKNIFLYFNTKHMEILSFRI